MLYRYAYKYDQLERALKGLNYFIPFYAWLIIIFFMNSESAINRYVNMMLC